MKVEKHHEDDCLMCAVRALTEGRALEWNPEGLGMEEEISGVVLRQGTQPSHFAGPVPFIELWTEGRALEWNPEGLGMEEISGVVLRQGTQPSHFAGPVPFIELWIGGRDRRRVTGHSAMLRDAITAGELQVGDTVTVKYLGMREVKRTPSQERTGQPANQIKVFELSVNRGHR